MTNFTLRRLQEEHKPWQLRNFGEHDSSHPYEGIVEEFGELADATINMGQNAPIVGYSLDKKREAIGDALSDILIYCADYCNCRNWNMQEIFESNDCKYFNWKFRSAWSILSELGKLAHSDLKVKQNIRKNEDHELNGKKALARLLGIVRNFAIDTDIDLMEFLENTWKVVSARDWNKHREEYSLDSLNEKLNTIVPVGENAIDENKTDPPPDAA